MGARPRCVPWSDRSSPWSGQGGCPWLGRDCTSLPAAGETAPAKETSSGANPGPSTPVSAWLGVQLTQVSPEAGANHLLSGCFRVASVSNLWFQSALQP